MACSWLPQLTEAYAYGDPSGFNLVVIEGSDAGLKSKSLKRDKKSDFDIVTGSPVFELI